MPKFSAFERLSHPFTKNRQPFELLSHIRSQIIFIRPTAVHFVRRWMAYTFTNGSSAALVSLSAFKRHKQINPTVRINSLNIRSFLYTGWKGKYIKPRPHVSGYFRIRILSNPYTFLSGYAFRPHASSESDLRIWKLLNPLSRVETFESDLFSDTCGRSNPDTFESDDVARSGPVSTVVSTAWLQNNMATN